MRFPAEPLRGASGSAGGPPPQVQRLTGRAARARRRRRSRARVRPSGRTGRLARRRSRASPPRGVATISSLVAPAASARATACWNDARRRIDGDRRRDAHERPVRSSMTDAANELPSTAIASSSASSCTASRRRCSLVVVHGVAAHLTCCGRSAHHPVRDEIRPRRIDRALQQPDLDSALDRLAARRDAELAVDRDRLGLRGVARDEQPARRSPGR